MCIKKNCLLSDNPLMHKVSEAICGVCTTILTLSLYVVRLCTQYYHVGKYCNTKIHALVLYSGTSRGGRAIILICLVLV